MTGDAREYLATVLPVPVPLTAGVGRSDETLAALRSLCADPHVMRVGTTVGIIASKAGLSFAQTQRDLIYLTNRGDAVELCRLKEEGFQPRYVVKAAE